MSDVLGDLLPVLEADAIARLHRGRVSGLNMTVGLRYADTLAADFDNLVEWDTP